MDQDEEDGVSVAVGQKTTLGYRFVGSAVSASVFHE